MPRLSTRRSTFNLLPLVILLLTLFVVGFGLIRGFSSFRKNLSRVENRLSLHDLWDEKNYSEILYQTQSRLLDNPFDSEALFFSGASSFYMAVSMVSYEDRLDYLHRAVTSLRKNLLSGLISYEKETCYLLGKCYVLSEPITQTWL